MIVQLPNGNTTQMSLDKYLDLSDEEFNALMWKTNGSETEDPFYDSTIRKKRKNSTISVDIYEEIVEEEDDNPDEDEFLLIDVLEVIQEIIPKDDD